MPTGNDREERLIAINPFGKIMTLPRLCFNSRLSGRSAFRYSAGGLLAKNGGRSAIARPRSELALDARLS